VLIHLGKNGADVEVNVAGVGDLEALLDGLLGLVEVVVFDLEGFVEVVERRPELLCSPEDAGEVVVGNCPVAVAFLSQRLSFP